jgi:hypothetical protein
MMCHVCCVVLIKEEILQTRAQSGNWAGYRRTGSNQQKIASAQYEQGLNLAKVNEDKGLNYDKRIPEMCREYPQYCKLLPGGEGFDILPQKDA